MKLEMLPPGQEATRIMPSAMVQLMDRPKARASRKVSSGSRTSWQTMPRIKDLGLLKTSANIFGWIPRATPYMTKARTMLMVFMPPALSVTSMLSMIEVISGVIAHNLKVKVRKKYQTAREKRHQTASLRGDPDIHKYLLNCNSLKIKVAKNY